MDKIKVMVSSRVEGLEAERDAIGDLYRDHPMIQIIGATPYSNASVAASSAVETTRMAKECDLYILLLGSSFGYKLTDGRSATEIEYDAAMRDDPTKVLVFLKETDCEPDEDQKRFIKKVCDYYSGYWRTTFRYSHKLADLVEESVLSWLKDRAAFHKKTSYCEHFIRYAIELKPTIETQVYYRVDNDHVEIEYKAIDISHFVHFDRRQIAVDFWRCVNELRQGVDRWYLEEWNK